MKIILFCCFTGIILMISVIVLLIKNPDKEVEENEEDKKQEEMKKDLYERLQNQKRYLRHLDEKHVQHVIEDEDYQNELKEVMKNINEIVDEMEFQELFKNGDQKEEQQTMTFNQQLINKLKELKYFCSMHDVRCRDCIYKKDDCQINMLTNELSADIPQDWDIERIEEIIDS